MCIRDRYNIAADIGEKNDVAKQNPDVVEKLAGMMHRVRTPSEVFPLIPLDAPAKKKPTKKTPAKNNPAKNNPAPKKNVKKPSPKPVQTN